MKQKNYLAIITALTISTVTLAQVSNAMGTYDTSVSEDDKEETTRNEVEVAEEEVSEETINNETVEEPTEITENSEVIGDETEKISEDEETENSNNVEENNYETSNKENINEQTDVAIDEETLEAQEGDELKTEPNETQTVSQAMPLIDSLEGTSIDVTNSEDRKYVDANGEELTEDEKAKVDEFLESLKKKEGYAIYSDTIDRTNHIEGNISANKVMPDTNIVISRVGELDANDKSYIGESNSSIQIQGNSENVTIDVGPNIDVSKPNPNQTIINGGYSNNITVNQLSEEEAKQTAEAVRKNLDEISEAGKDAKSEIDDAFYGDGKDAFEGVDNLLKNDVVKEGDVVCINVDYKQIINNEGAFGNIINNNNGTQVIINVLITDEDVTEINIFKGFTANTNVSTEFYKYSSYVVWNFGDYNGDINIKEEMVGIIVAPKGRVY